MKGLASIRGCDTRFGGEEVEKQRDHAYAQHGILLSRVRKIMKDTKIEKEI